MKLNKIQEQIITTDKSKVLVNSAAASGKTNVIIERIRFLLNKGVPANEIVAITFTNNAANEMYARLDHPEGLFIGTVHSYCNYLLKSYAIDTSEYIEKENFDELFEEVKRNPQCIKPVSYLIVDEAQDSTDPQFEFFELINPKNYMYCYDPRQSIYGFADANPDYLLEKEKEKDTIVYYMNYNYRNGSNILNFAKNLLYRLGADYEDTSIPTLNDEGYVYHTKWSYDNIVQNMKTVNKYGDWFVLCRSNREIDILSDKFDKEGIPYTTFKQGDLSTKEIDEELKSDKIKLLTIHSAKGLESECVLVVNSLLYNNEERRLYYVAATRAKTMLIWNKIKKEKNKNIVEWE